MTTGDVRIAMSHGLFTSMPRARYHLQQPTINKIKSEMSLGGARARSKVTSRPILMLLLLVLLLLLLLLLLLNLLRVAAGHVCVAALGRACVQGVGTHNS